MKLRPKTATSLRSTEFLRSQIFRWRVLHFFSTVSWKHPRLLFDQDRGSRYVSKPYSLMKSFNIKVELSLQRLSCPIWATKCGLATQGATTMAWDTKLWPPIPKNSGTSVSMNSAFTTCRQCLILCWRCPTPREGFTSHIPKAERLVL